MEWKTRTWPRPKWRDIRFKRVFAWTPVACEDGITRWLRYVDARQMYAAARYWITLDYWKPKSSDDCAEE